MPTVVQLPQAPNTSLGTLGQMLLAASSEYAQNRRQDDREARLRQERLSDVESDRQYQESRDSRQHTRARQEQLADIQSSRDWEQQRLEMALNLGLVRDGYLPPDKLKDAAAIRLAFQEAARDGLVQRHPMVKEAMAAGDLKDSDLGNPVALAAGLAQYSERAAKRSKFLEGQPDQAVARAGQLVGEREQLAQRGAELERRLSEPEPQPTQREVAARALQLAQATKKPGEMPSVQEIAAMQGQAAQEIAGQKAMAWNQQRQDALVQRSLINDRLRDVSAEINTLTNRFGVVGVGEGRPSPAAPPPPMRPQTNLATAISNFQASVAKPKASPAASAPTPVDPFTRLSDVGVFERPMIQQGRARIFAPDSPSLFDDATAATQAEISRLQGMTGARGSSARLALLTEALNELQRRRSQLDTRSAQQRLNGPVGNAMETVPPTQPGAEWWREP